MRAGHADREPSWRPSASSASRGSASASRTSTTEILELNGRAHRSPEIFRAYELARALGFPQINIDLIAGMVGETEDNWHDCVEKTLELAARQRHHLPDGAAVQHDDQRRPAEGHRAGSREPVADWPTKRRWVAGGLRGARGAPAITSAAPTPPSKDPVAHAVRLPRPPLAGRRHGRASASPRSATSTACTCRTSTPGRPTAPRFDDGELPLSRAYRPTDEERLIRELVLQLKLGLGQARVLPREVRRGHPRAVPRASSTRWRPRAISRPRPTTSSR